MKTVSSPSCAEKAERSRPMESFCFTAKRNGSCIFQTSVPVVVHDLTTVEYNVCFDEFWSSIGKRVFKGKKAKISGGEVACEDLLSPTLKRLFNTFSITANR